MQWSKHGVTWGGPQDDWYWFYWWNWLPDHLRYFGYCQDWYDGPLSSFGFWFINWTWTPIFFGHNGDKDFSYKTRKKAIDTKTN